MNATAITSLLANARAAHCFDIEAQAAFLADTHRAWDKTDLIAAAKLGLHRLYDLPASWHYEEAQVVRAMDAVNELLDALYACTGNVNVLGATVVAA